MSDFHADLEHDSPPGIPRWVKTSALVFVILFLVVAGLHFTGTSPTHGIAMHGMP